MTPKLKNDFRILKDENWKLILRLIKNIFKDSEEWKSKINFKVITLKWKTDSTILKNKIQKLILRL